jgi:hypothetical protein
MSRVLKAKRQTLDYSLWQKIRFNAINVTKDQGRYLADRDRGESDRSEFFSRDGRALSELDETVVYDFISLSSSFDPWFDRIRLDKESLLNEIEEFAIGMNGGQIYFDGIGEQWLEIDWGTLGRVIGAATANIGRQEKWWNVKGRDAQMSLAFWGDLDRKMPKVSDGKGIPEKKWDDWAQFYRQKKFDPSSEILRAHSHRPSSPFWRTGGIEGIEFFPNPLALLHRKRLQEKFRNYGDEGEWEPREIANFHGQLTMDLIQQAMVLLGQGKYVEFAIRIHGVCAAHVMRTVVTQQKIGLHLISNLAIRKQTRDVDAQNVPDIAYHLSTGFHLAKVLHILQRTKLIDWVAVDKEIVDKAREEIS